MNKLGIKTFFKIIFWLSDIYRNFFNWMSRDGMSGQYVFCAFPLIYFFMSKENGVMSYTVLKRIYVPTFFGRFGSFLNFMK